jgi:hypothetical protein
MTTTNKAQEESIREFTKDAITAFLNSLLNNASVIEHRVDNWLSDYIKSHPIPQPRKINKLKIGKR